MYIYIYIWQQLICMYTSIFFPRTGPYKHTHNASHLHTVLCICLLSTTIEEIKSQLCPSRVVLSHKQGECEKSDVSKKEGEREEERESPPNNEYESSSSTNWKKNVRKGLIIEYNHLLQCLTHTSRKRNFRWWSDH